jgi:hypothetical protein
MNLSLRARRILLGIIVVFFIGLVAFMVISFLLKGNPYGDEVVIKNYKETVKNLSDDYEDLIMSSLYQTIKLNIPEGTPVPEVNDATIRSDTASQTYEKLDNIYQGSFIVDMESLQQSYRVEYSYSNNPDNVALGGYPIIASCLPVEDLIYGDFGCKDSLVIETGEVNPIVGILPRSTLTYEIRAVTNENNSVKLTIQLLLTRVDYTTREAAAVKEYKAEALAWIRSQGFNPNDYAIEYVY